MEAFYMIVGLAMFYSWIHFGSIQHKSNWSERTQYEKAVSVFALVVFALFVVGAV